MQEIRLNEYRAQIKGLQLTLGTWDSYGIEKLKIIPGTGWEGLTITATFVTPEGSTRVLVPQDGMLPVPQEATAHPLPSGSQGQIVFTGVAEGIQRISTNVLYIVSDHAPIEGEDSHPTPSEFAQFVAQVQGAASDAKKSATEAADSASAAAASAGEAENSATQAAASQSAAAESATQAGQSATKAAESANLAQQGAANAGWFNVEGVDGILYLVRSDNAPEDFALQDNGEGVLEAVYG